MVQVAPRLPSLAAPSGKPRHFTECYTVSRCKRPEKSSLCSDGTPLTRGRISPPASVSSATPHPTAPPQPPMPSPHFSRLYSLCKFPQLSEVDLACKGGLLRVICVFGAKATPPHTHTHTHPPPLPTVAGMAARAGLLWCSASFREFSVGPTLNRTQLMMNPIDLVPFVSTQARPEVCHWPLNKMTTHIHTRFKLRLDTKSEPTKNNCMLQSSKCNEAYGTKGIK